MFNKHIVVFFNLKVFNSRDILKCFGGINPQITSIKSTLIIFAYFILKAFKGAMWIWSAFNEGSLYDYVHYSTSNIKNVFLTKEKKVPSQIKYSIIGQITEFFQGYVSVFT